jgi:hypothetical protein
MQLDPRSFPIEPGYLYEGWIYEGIVELPKLGGPMTHTLFFTRAGEKVAVTNGQTAAAAQFCLRNGKVDICPTELVPFAIGTFDQR